MKQILFATFLICALSSFAQEKKDVKVISTVSDTSNLFKRLSLAFYEKGYTLETKDESVGFIKTKQKEMEKYSGLQSISAFVKSGSIIFSSTVWIKGVGSLDVAYYNEKKNLFTVAWREVVDIAKQFGPVSYSK